MRFSYYEPATVEEAVDILRQGKGRYKALAGGTDVIINLRRRTATYDALVNIKRIPGIATWTSEPGIGLRIGAATPFRMLERSATVATRFPALSESIKVIGSLQLRHMATIGGNLCNASPAADSAPALMVSGAMATFASNGSTQTVPVEQFFSGPGRCILDTADLLLSVEVPEPEGMVGSSFQRLTPRSAMDIGIASAASQVTLEPSTGRVQEVAIVLGAVAPTPLRASRAEEVVRGHEPTPEVLARAGATAREECSPIDDIRGSASYRRAMVEVLVRRTLEVAVARAKSPSERV